MLTELKWTYNNFIALLIIISLPTFAMSLTYFCFPVPFFLFILYSTKPGKNVRAFSLEYRRKEEYTWEILFSTLTLDILNENIVLLSYLLEYIKNIWKLNNFWLKIDPVNKHLNAKNCYYFTFHPQVAKSLTENFF